MVCSACAYENPPGMRYCGMCGMPMPHKPITAPGAHSTLSFTRVPMDAREMAAAREHSEASRAGGAVAVEPVSEPVGALKSESPSVETPATATTASFPGPSEPPAQGLVPDIPLDEYVSKFRYEPPRDPGERTMRWDAPLPSARPQPPITEPPQDPDHIPASPVFQNASASDEDVDQRLGLEPESQAEASIARPRFLDINEPALPNNSMPRDDGSGEKIPLANRAPAIHAPTIGGPSFLGLSDTPQSWADAIGVEKGKYAPRNYHLRAWFALAVVLLFAWLGYLQYRAQVDQTNNGPVEVVRTKLRDWRQTAMAKLDEPPDEGSKPEIQVQPQQGPTQTRPGADANPPVASSPQTPQSTSKSDTDSANNSAPTSNAPPVANTAPPAEPPKVVPGNSTQTPAPEAPEADANNSVGSARAPSPTKRPPDAADTAAAKPSSLGSEEMAKAKNASDPAAAAAWLWKATAKGNPDAPVQLANMYIQGNGVPRSCEQALVLLKTAAEKENTVARNRLGSMYANATCVPLNRVEAYRWYSASLSANPNSQWTQQTRDAIWQQMAPGERALAQKYR